MESSQIVGVSSGQKCSDNTESGWTMYIGSQIFNTLEEEDVDNHDDIIDHHGVMKFGACDDDESDDSMASDASSGPIIDQSVKNTRLNNSEKPICFSSANNNKKLCKQVIKKSRDERRVIRRSEKSSNYDHEHTVSKAESAESQV